MKLLRLAPTNVHRTSQYQLDIFMMRVPRSVNGSLTRTLCVLLQNFAFSITTAQYGGDGHSTASNITTSTSIASATALSTAISSSDFSRIQESVNLFFTAVFTLELILNVYAHWLWPFFQNG
jgi:hypothetical protein